MSIASHYVELGISSSATADEVRAAYRQAALEHHPDKNRDDPSADSRFQRIQEAYAVLSNEHERAWYDSQQQKSSRGSGILDVAALMRDGAFDGFGNNDNSFWDVYAVAFTALAREEEERSEDQGKRNFDARYPPFGGKKAGWEVVKRFYGWWESFASRREFSEADKWNLAEARSRFERRAMEKENTRERTKKKKEYNAEVRDLVAWVKKRDPRVKKRKEEEEEERKLEAQKRKRRGEERKTEKEQVLRAATMASEAALEEDAEALDDVLMALELDEEIERKGELEREEDAASKLESDDSVQLYPEGKEEPQMLKNGYLDSENFEDDEGEENESDDLVEEPYCAACKKLFKSVAQRENHEKSKKHKNTVIKMRQKLVAEDEEIKRHKDQKCVSEESNEHEAANKEVDGSEKARNRKRKKQKKKQRLWERVTVDSVTDGGRERDDVGGSDGPDRFAQEADEQNNPIREHVASNCAASEGYDKVKDPARHRSQEKHRKGRRRKRDKKKEDVIKCNACSEIFPSRTKLFAHVREFGHALHVESKVKKQQIS